MNLQYIYHKKVIEEHDYVRKCHLRYLTERRGMQRMLNNLTDDEFELFVNKLKDTKHAHLL